jgi:predicted protein tyrosine phosphatase
MNVPYPDSYWVIPGKLLAGEYPANRWSDDQTRSRIQSLLLQAGVRVFIDLTRPGELVPYLPILQEQSQWLNIPVEYQRFPILDYGIPTREQMTAILDRIDAALAHNQTVYLHCWGGIGRTGTVVGCHLVRRGLNGEQALAEIQRLRSAVPDPRPSPESDDQWGFVRGWKEEYRE